ncbi:caspase family protein [Nostoc sp. MS1]|uniref:caspase family protein n=1 Tax=Nostoc sp. MS1 TaxID=2764711 RepID=UPI001CC4F4A8|nr:HEAT repeat domain-containing protein [Nostoc sp. MS1]BCL37814.1 hypothetical protein NSMS1_42610 [Nostoc sp. MS1]
MFDWNPYLESIRDKYAQWWESYTITDVVGKNPNKLVGKPNLLNLQASIITADPVQTDRQLLPEAKEEKEVLNVLEGLQKYAAEHILLIGRPGSGKSTALVRLLLEFARFGEANSTQHPQGKQNEVIPTTTNNFQIPVLVELRYYETSILDLITAFLNRHYPSLSIDTETVKTLLRQGQFLLLIDGVNELPSPEAQRNLQKFRLDYEKTTPMVFTTRDLGVGGDLAITKKLEMQPLTEAQMADFVRKYLPETGEQMLQQLGGRLKEFGETPLLLLMLCSVFASNNNQIPPNLGSMFRLFTETYDNKLKQDIPVSQESRRWWKRLLQHLAWVMMNSPQTKSKGFRELNQNEKTEFLVAIPRQQAEEIFTEFLAGKVNCAADCAIAWLNDLLKHHLIQIGADNKIEFRHQLIQEYYAAESLLQKVEKLTDDELQWDYLNYLKWTEPAALMMGLIDVSALALRVVKLALKVDWQLGARLAGKVKLKWQKKTVGLIIDLNLPQLLQIRLLGISQSDAAVSSLIDILNNEDTAFFEDTILALVAIGSKKAMESLVEFIKDEYDYEDIFIWDDNTISLEDIDSWDKILNIFQISKYDLTYRNKYIFKTSLGDSNETIGEQAITSRNIQYLLNPNNQREYFYISNEENINYEVLISEILDEVKNDNREIRNHTYLRLSKISSRKAINILVQALKNEDDNLILHRLSATLRNLVSEPDIPVLIQLLQHHHFIVRLNAVCALGKIGCDSVIPGLMIALQDKSEDVRSDSALAIGDIGSDVASPGLIALMKKQYAPNLIRALERIQQRRKYYKPRPKFTMSNILSHNYALLIGVGECEEAKLSLPVTVKDIQALKTLLTDQNVCGYIDNDQHLCLLHDATATSENILNGLNWLKQQAENDPEATIFIYYSGHGFLDESGDYYLIPHETDRVDIPNTALSAKQFNTALQQIPAKRLLVTIDSCHAQGMASSKEGANKRSILPKGFTQTALPKNIIDELKQGTGKVVFTSSTGNQLSWIRPDKEMSVYTYHLLEALQGAANQLGDEVVRVSHLMNYLGKTVAESARDLCKAEQTPFFDFATEDFPVALLRGGKGLAPAGWDKQEAKEKIEGIYNNFNISNNKVDKMFNIGKIEGGTIHVN